MERWARALYTPNLPLYGGKRVTASEEHIEISHRAAAEGMVLLKNEKNVLPLAAGTKVALFGKGTFDYVRGGGGSGEVYSDYVINLYEGLNALPDAVTLYQPLCDFYRENVAAQYAGGAAAGMTVEPALPEELAKGAAAFTDTAVITLSRFSGEGWDRSDVEYEAEYNPWGNEVSMPKKAGKVFPDGDFYLTVAERSMIETVKSNFARVIVVLNVGGVMETAWIKEDPQISSALITWAPGMEGGTAMAEILTGKVNPSGHLTDTFARRLEDYPSTDIFHESPHYAEYTEDIYVGYRYFATIPGAQEKIVYPFGYGLSYTTFALEQTGLTEVNGEVTVSVNVVNTGYCAGREVVQLYVSAPQGKLGKSARSLAGFRKTRLLQPGEQERITLRVQLSDLASYDDLGKVAASAWVLEQGEYAFYLGTSVENAERLEQTVILAEDVITEQLSAKLVPTDLKKRLCADGSYESLPTGQTNDMNACLFEKMVPGTEEALTPAAIGRASYMLLDAFKKDAVILKDVAEGRADLEMFLDQLSDEELLHLLGGQPNTGVANTFGYGNLPEYGVPNIMTADGPAGLRVSEGTGIHTTAFPCGTLLACTWDEELVELVGRAGGEEVKENNIGVWLTPAVCIHRNPMCGRNFEYYSEDPFVSGKIGAAMVKGIQSQHVAAAVKHFAANNKETNRKHSDSRVSERALREIYLKQFEIIVKESDPWVIMSSYNAINGHRASENKELLEDVLRDEWGFKGMVTTDWWTRGEHYKEILAGNDAKMAAGFPERVKKAMELGAVGREDLKHCARRVLELILKID